jgi:hypothetical protein
MGGSARGPLLLAGGLAVIVSVFMLWVGELRAIDLRLLAIFQGFEGEGTEPWWRSIGAALMAGAVGIIISAFIGSRALSVLAALVTGAIWGLWVYQEFNSYPQFEWTSLQPGAWVAAGGIALSLGACLIGDASRSRY